MKRQNKSVKKKESRIERKAQESAKDKKTKISGPKKVVKKKKSEEKFENTMPIMLGDYLQKIEDSDKRKLKIKPKVIQAESKQNLDSIMDNIIDEIVNKDQPEKIVENKVAEKAEIKEGAIEEKKEAVAEEKTEVKTEEPKKQKEKKKQKLGTIINSVLFIIFLGLFIFSLTKIIIYFKHAKANKELTEELNQAIVVEEEDNKPKFQIDFEMLKSKNPDTVGFIKVNGTDVNHVVVKSSDNAFYLTRDFDKNYNSAGWIFADYRNSFDHMDQNTIIYGHNMKNGTMFSSLKNILTDEWKDNPENLTVTLVTERKERKYQVFSVYLIDNTDDYTKVSFNGVEYTKFIEMIKGRSKYNFNVDVTKEDRILTLSTCGVTSNQRIVLHAKEIR